MLYKNLIYFFSPRWKKDLWQSFVSITHLALLFPNLRDILFTCWIHCRLLAIWAIVRVTFIAFRIRIITFFNLLSASIGEILVDRCLLILSLLLTHLCLGLSSRHHESALGLSSLSCTSHGVLISLELVCLSHRMMHLLLRVHHLLLRHHTLNLRHTSLGHRINHLSACYHALRLSWIHSHLLMMHSLWNLWHHLLTWHLLIYVLALRWLSHLILHHLTLRSLHLLWHLLLLAQNLLAFLCLLVLPS